MRVRARRRENGKDAPERLDGLGERVRGVGDEGIEAVPEGTLSDELERDAAHPADHVDLTGACTDASSDSGFELP